MERIPGKSAGRLVERSAAGRGTAVPRMADPRPEMLGWIRYPSNPANLPGRCTSECDWGFYTAVHTTGPKFGPGTNRNWIAGDWHLGVQIMIAADQLSAGSQCVAELLGVLSLMAGSAPEAQVPLKVGTPSKGSSEAIVDKAVRMVLR